MLISITTVLLANWNTTGITVAGSSVGAMGVSANLLNNTYGLTLDSSNSLYIADSNNNRIQKCLINASNCTTVAGQTNGTSGASSTVLFQPVSVVLDSNDNMYFTDRGNHRVVYWARGASSGMTIAGTTGTKDAILF
jgi:sugar lactone lactonase YvrE